MAAKMKRKPFSVALVETTPPLRTIKLGQIDATTPTFAERAAYRKYASFMKSLQCGGYKIVATEI